MRNHAVDSETAAIAGTTAEHGPGISAQAPGSGLWSRWALLIFTSFILAVAMTEVETYSQNTFLYHPNWVVSKLTRARPVMGAMEPFEHRNTLAGNRLNLDAWYGCSEFLVNRVFELQSLSFRFRLGRQGELNVLFNRNRDSVSGFRVRREENGRVTHFQADASGRFHETASLGEIPLCGGWHRARLQLESGRASFTIDDRPLPAPDERPLAMQTLGFRSGCSGEEVMPPPVVQVDDVHVTDASNRTIVRESFRNTTNYSWLLPAAWLLTLGAGVGACSMRRNSASAPFPAVIAIQLLLTTLLAMYFLFDYGYWSKQYLYEGYTPWGYDPSPKLCLFERGRAGLADLLRRIDRPPGKLDLRPEPVATLLGAEQCLIQRSMTVVGALPGRKGAVEVIPDDLASVQRIAPLVRQEKARVVMLMGTSQLWGAGALREEDTIAVQLQRFLATQDVQHRYIVVNMSASGSSAEPLFRDYQERGVLLQPSLLVVVLSNNDSPFTDVFHDTLTSLVSYTRCRRIRTVFVTEPSQSRHRVNLNHRDMRCIAASTGTPLLDLAPYMRAREGSGFLWWDSVHLTPYGQMLAAQFIGKGLVDNHLLAPIEDSLSPAPPAACSEATPNGPQPFGGP
jgi:hypothetical protein